MASLAPPSSPMDLVTALDTQGCLRKSVRAGLLLYEETEECQSGERSGEQGTDGQGESWEALKDKEYSVDDAW